MFQWLQAHLAFVLGPLWEYVKVLFMGAVHNELAAVMPIAMQAVKDFAADPTLLTGPDKRAAAFTKILADLSAASINAAVSTVNLAIELAVKNLTPATPTP